jgi:hypothetical protein
MPLQDEMIKKCQTEMINSHTSGVLEIARERIRPIFERINRHRALPNKMDYWSYRSPRIPNTTRD